MEFFCYHRDRPGSLPLRERLIEEHWSYMDRFSLIARGPTFDGGVLTGSVHIVDVPDAAAARAFAFEEPCYQAGAYRDVVVRRWRNVLGRTMWDAPAGGGHLVLGFGSGSPVDLQPASDDGLIAYGPLLSDDGSSWLGTAALVRSADPAAVLSVDRYDAVEVHEWEPGGRR
ncbi:YciI family protein [Lentzea sp. NPDC005914]|uniref:YciI family protein n=1 Tax=Lentzea sp. NPDC005914 TaxID=3154572 RepID=UPI0033F10E46